MNQYADTALGTLAALAALAGHTAVYARAGFIAGLALWHVVLTEAVVFLVKYGRH